VSQTSADISETEFGGSALPKRKKIIPFSNGETLEVEDPTPFNESAQRVETCLNEKIMLTARWQSVVLFLFFLSQTKLSFKNVAILVWRISLLSTVTKDN